MNCKAIPVFLIVAGAATFSLAVSCDSIDNIGETRLKGPLGEKLDRMVAGHVIGTDVDYITAPFLEKTETKGWWQTEFWGKWMHSAVPYSVYTGSAALGASIDRGIDRMLASQEKNGYIGNYPDELRCADGWDVWGMKYTMMGLLHYYDLLKAREIVGDKSSSSRKDVNLHSPTQISNSNSSTKALEAAKRLCDYVIAEIGPKGRRGREL